MNPVPLFLIIVTLPLLLGGCGEKESVADVTPVEEKVFEVKEEVNPEEPVAETKARLYSFNYDEFERRDGIYYLKNSDTLLTGKAVNYHSNGYKASESNYKDGKRDGLSGLWHENGYKASESIYKDGNLVEGSKKFWNRKAEPVGSLADTVK